MTHPSIELPGAATSCTLGAYVQGAHEIRTAFFKGSFSHAAELVLQIGAWRSCVLRFRFWVLISRQQVWKLRGLRLGGFEVQVLGFGGFGFGVQGSGLRPLLHDGRRDKNQAAEWRKLQIFNPHMLCTPV